MQLINKREIAPGLIWVEIKEADLYLCCGCPTDAVKFLKKKKLLSQQKKRGPNAILVSDHKTQKGRVKNFSEFLLMDMLYNRGMIKNIQNGGDRPCVIGLKETVDQQVNYTCRGNYGFFTKEEMLQSGISKTEAEKYMRLKLWFANHNIYQPDELLHSIYLENEKTEILNGVTIERESMDRFIISYKNEKCHVDLNIDEEVSRLPFRLKNYKTELNSFSIMHAGEGNGWHEKNPCMSSMLIHEGKVLAVDVGPGFSDVINHLGLDIQDIEGVFMTHNHDDHFAGLTDLLKSTHQIKLYASKLVRLTIQKKFAELLGLKEADFHHFFSVIDLQLDQWNDIDGLEVKPVFTPHPVETNAFIFRKESGEGEAKIYSHLADTISLKTYEKFIKNEGKGLFDEEDCEKLRKYYLQQSDVKKVDVGGGLIHGEKADFESDQSEIIVYSHTDFPTVKDKGGEMSAPSFGRQDILISGDDTDYHFPIFHGILKKNFPDIDDQVINEIYHESKIVEKKKGTPIRLKNKKVILILSGNVVSNNVRFADRKLFDRDHILGLSELFSDGNEGYKVNTSFIRAIEIDKNIFLSKVGKLKSWNEYIAKKEMIRVVECSKLFSHFSCSNIKLQLASLAGVKVCTEEKIFSGTSLNHLWIVKHGQVHCRKNGKRVLLMEEGSFFGGKSLIHYGMQDVDFQASAGALLVKIPENSFQNIPLITWMVYENCTTLDHICKVKGHK